MEYALFPINHAAGDVLGAFGVDGFAGGGDGEGAAGDGYILGGLEGMGHTTGLAGGFDCVI